MPLVSVVVTSYNRVGMLRETVESILAQTFTDFELLIVDNCSSDGTDEYLRALQSPRVRYLRHANGGLAAVNRNLGILEARGRYVAFCDDDDLWVPEKLERQVAVMEADSSMGLCCSGNKVLRNGRIEESRVKPKLGLITRDQMLLRNRVATSSVMMRRTVAVESGGFNSTGEFAPYDDYEFWLRIVARNKAILIPDPLLIYRVHGSNVSPVRHRGIGLMVRILLAARASIGAGGPWYWFCLLVRGTQFGYLRLRQLATGRRASAN